LPGSSDLTTIRIDTPAGQITATATINDGVVTRVNFLNVPSFVVSQDATVHVPEFGEVRYDLAFGGGFYAYVEASSIGQDLDDTASLVASGRKIKQAVMDTVAIIHPNDEELGFLYGVIFTGPPVRNRNHSRHVCVFADGEIDRSPTGTGVSGRLALLHARGELGLGEEMTVESITGSEFVGRVAEETNVGGLPAVIPEVAGEAHLLGRSEYWFDPSDNIGKGFMLR
jgi:trans-L-3-hydroxyproline dehydratase